MSATPILDLEQDPPTRRRSRWARWLPLLIGALIGVTLSAMDWSPDPDSWPGFNPLLWFPGIYVTITIHELAHLGVGMLRGMDPGGLIIGGFRLMRSGDRWTLRVEWKQFIIGGLAMPMSTKDTSVADFVWMVAAGPVASILCTLVLWIAFLHYGSGAWDWIGSFFWGSLLGIFSLIPMSVGAHKSDTARIWMLLKHPSQAMAWMAAVAIQAENIKGVRPRDWDADMFARMMSTPQPGGGRIFPELMAYQRSLEEGNEPSACLHLENAIGAAAKAGKVIQQALYLEAAEVNAMLKHNAANARTWLARALKLRKPESSACAESAVAIAEGRYEDALAKIDAARAHLRKRKQDSGTARFAHERLNQRERLCKEALRVTEDTPVTP
jgi:hypothetical protein